MRHLQWHVLKAYATMDSAYVEHFNACAGMHGYPLAIYFFFVRKLVSLVFCLKLWLF